MQELFLSLPIGNLKRSFMWQLHETHDLLKYVFQIF